MRTAVTIKGIEDETWRLFKSDAARQGQTTAQHFAHIVQNHCAALPRQDALKVIERLRAKSGNWSGSQEIAKWRKKRAF